MPKDKISVQIWTEKFLGTGAKCEELVALIQTMDEGRWRPQKWSNCEPVRTTFLPDSLDAIRSEWMHMRGHLTANEMFFRRQKPYGEIWVSIWKGRRPWLNSVSLSFDAKAFEVKDGPERLQAIIRCFIEWSQAVYASAHHTKQLHRRCAQGTPMERLESGYWLTFFCKPYLELFGGRERLMACPCFKVEPLADGVLLIAAPRPNSAEMTESSDTLITMEQYLGAESFARDFYVQERCKVPVFDLSETINEISAVAPKEEPNPKEPIILTHSKTGKPIAFVVIG